MRFENLGWRSADGELARCSYVRPIWPTRRPGTRAFARCAGAGCRPFPVETTYAWEDVDGTSTRMTLRNRGLPSGLSRALTPLMPVAVARANRGDLAPQAAPRVLDRDRPRPVMPGKRAGRPDRRTMGT